MQKVLDPLTYDHTLERIGIGFATRGFILLAVELVTWWLRRYHPSPNSWMLRVVRTLGCCILILSGTFLQEPVQMCACEDHGQLFMGPAQVSFSGPASQEGVPR